MTTHRTPAKYALAGLAGVALAVWLSAEAQEGKSRIEVCRHRHVDGRASDPVDLTAVARLYRSTAAEVENAVKSGISGIAQTRLGGHHSGLRSCSASRERIVHLRAPVPPQLRKATLYFLRAPRGGLRPPVLPASLPQGAEVFVLDADSMKDAIALSKALGRRVTLATREFAQALGVECAPSRVTFDEGGRSSIVLEAIP